MPRRGEAFSDIHEMHVKVDALRTGEGYWKPDIDLLGYNSVRISAMFGLFNAGTVPSNDATVQLSLSANGQPILSADIIGPVDLSGANVELVPAGMYKQIEKAPPISLKSMIEEQVFSVAYIGNMRYVSFSMVRSNHVGAGDDYIPFTAQVVLSGSQGGVGTTRYDLESNEERR